MKIIITYHCTNFIKVITNCNTRLVWIWVQRVCIFFIGLIHAKTDSLNFLFKFCEFYWIDTTVLFPALSSLVNWLIIQLIICYCCCCCGNCCCCCCCWGIKIRDKWWKLKKKNLFSHKKDGRSCTLAIKKTVHVSV